MLVTTMVIGLSFLTRNCGAQDRKVSGDITYMTRGIAPVPAFAIEEGAFYASILVDFGRIEILMDMAVDDGRIDRRGGEFWFSDLWLRGYAVKNETTKVRASVNWSPFGQWYGLVLGINPDTTSFEVKAIHEVTRYFLFEGYAEHSINPRTDVSLTYWYNQGFGERTINGSFLSLAVARTLVVNDFSITAKPSVFGIYFTGENDGVFGSGTLAIEHSSLPLILSSQIVIPFETNVPNPETSWNVGLTFLF